MPTMAAINETGDWDKHPKGASRGMKIPNPDGVALKRASRRPTLFGEGSIYAGADPQGDLVSQADRSDTFLQTGKRNANYENTFKMEPDTTFKVKAIESLVNNILAERLKDVPYDPLNCKNLSQELAAVIMDKIKALAIKRYKLVAVVSLGSLKEQPGMQFGSRCLWNKQTDSFVSIKYSNASLFAIAMVYGLYYE
ncbi:dynein light chain Tctex-type 5-B-like [Lineus longissimus]|uniref:dynein light chain Tctex-type 5-B-like n=1 Tax=Lineus longissimus TaxID=88925 RepID=UPI002B4C9D21